MNDIFRQTLNCNDARFTESLSFIISENVTRLHCDQPLNTVDGDLFTFVRNYQNGVTQLRFVNNNISNVANDAFYNMRHLVNVSLRMNKLTAFSGDVFIANRLLEHLDLSRNQIVSLTGSLMHLSNLKTFKISSNAIEILHEDTFKILFVNGKGTLHLYIIVDN